MLTVGDVTSFHQEPQKRQAVGDRLSLRSSTSLASSHVATRRSGTCHVVWHRATTDSRCSMPTVAGTRVPIKLLISPVWMMPTISSLKITDRSFRCASPRLWDQLPDSFRQPHHSRLDSPHPLLNSSLSSSPLSSSITPSLFLSKLKTYLFNKSFPP